MPNSYVVVRLWHPVKLSSGVIRVGHVSIETFIKNGTGYYISLYPKKEGYEEKFTYQCDSHKPEGFSPIVLHLIITTFYYL